MVTLEKRLLSKRKIDSVTGCWLWTGYINQLHGYGYINVGGRPPQGRPRHVHRVAASLWLGFDMDDPRFVCHRCDNRPCFNPDHLFIGTQKDNIRDALKKGRCSNGNPRLTAEDAREIERLAKSGVVHRVLADRFGVSRPLVSKIVRHETWVRLWD
jgi:hypothetical protein